MRRQRRWSLPNISANTDGSSARDYDGDIEAVAATSHSAGNNNNNRRATVDHNHRLSSTTVAGITLIEDDDNHNFAVIYDDFLLDQLQDAFGVDF